MIRRFPALLALLLLVPACSDNEGESPNEPPPPAPTGLTALGNSARSVLLGWTDPTPDEYGFHIWYRVSGVGTFALLKTVPVNATSDTPSGLDPATAYDFQVTAFNARGDSAPSNTATATTDAFAWTYLADAAPALKWAQAVYVPAPLDRVVVFGGGVPPIDDLHTVNPATGAMALLAPASGTRPGARLFPSVVYDSLRNSLILFGGYHVLDDLYKNDVWEFDFDTNLWAELLPVVPPGGAAPTARNGHSAVYDSIHGTMVVFGGTDEPTAGLVGDVHRLLLPAAGNPTWETLTVTGTLPVPRDLHTAVFDALNSRMILFAGNDGGSLGNPSTNELSSLALNDTSTVVWTRLSSQLDVPAPRTGHVAVYDGVNRQMVVFGGQLEGVAAADFRLWTLSLDGSNVWNEIALPSPPGGRLYASAAFDPTRIRMILFGGEDGLGVTDPEIWALEL